MADGDNSDSYIFSLSITPPVCCSEGSEWILDMSATYHVCPKREWFASFEKLDGGLDRSAMDTHAILKGHV